MKKIDKFFKNYISNLSHALLKTNLRNLDKVAKEIIKTIKKKNTIFVCGNGGSAAISNHYICDFIKSFRQKTKFKPKIISLSNNIETLTAISNDLDYKYVFSFQAESLCKKNDLIIIISSSGNSKNIVELLKFSKKNNLKTIGFSGFDGGYLKKSSDISVHINADDYGISEDSHHILMHILLQHTINLINKS